MEPVNLDRRESRPTVLIVEDEPDVATFIAAVLGDNGFRVLTAADGVEAMRLLRANRPQLVTLDISIPEKSGVKCYREMRDDTELAATPVVMVTGIQPSFEKFIHTRRQVPPPDGYVAKPFTAEQLLTAVQKALAQAEG